jgi:hypothetical protein
MVPKPWNPSRAAASGAPPTCELSPKDHNSLNRCGKGFETMKGENAAVTGNLAN